MYDLVIRGGRVLDPGQDIDRQLDLAIHKGRIARLAADLAHAEAREVLDASGYLVTPGWIDIHVHVYQGVSHYGILPDLTCLARGVTTVCDAGSAGADTFEGLRRYVIDVSDTRILAFLNISGLGMVSPVDNELEDLKHANLPRAIEVCERHRDIIQGVKIRLGHSMVGPNGLQPLRLAKQAAEAIGLPLMVHVGHTPAPLGEILSELRPGDLLTHCFHGKKHGILDKNGAVLSEVRDAIEQGILFDVGHGLGSFSFDVAAQAMEQGMTPATISSDLHFYNLHGPVFDLATTVSKFLLLGMRLDEALAKVTVAPARILGLKDQLGSLGEGCLADIAIFDVRVGEFSFRDSMGKCLTGREALEPVAVVKAGRIYRSDLWCNRRTLHLDEDLKSISP